MNHRTKITLIALVISFSFLLRFPNLNHPSGVDMFFNIIQANLLSEHGNISWLLNIYSAFGTYPLSQEIGVPVILAEVYLLCGLDMDIICLIISLYFGLLGTFGIFLVSRELTSHFSFSFFSAILYSACPAFLIFTSWNLSARGPFVAILPILVYEMIRAPTGIRHLTLFLLMILLLFTIHNLSLVMTYMLLVSFIHYISLRKKSIRKVISNKYVYTVLSILLILLPYFGIIRNPSLEPLSQGLLQTGYHFSDVYLNLIIQYTRSIGLLAPFFILGIDDMFKGQTKTGAKHPIPMILLFLVPFVFDLIYVSLFVSMFLILVVALGIDRFCQIMHSRAQGYKSLVFPLVMVFLLLFAYVPEVVVFVDEEGDTYDPDSSYNSGKNTGIYTSYQFEDEIILSFGFAKKIGAYNGGNTVFDYHTDLIVHGALTEDQVIAEVKSISLVSIVKGEQKAFFTMNDWTGAGGGYYSSKRGPHISSNEFDEYFNILFMESYGVHYIFAESESETIFLEGVKNNRFKVYSDEMQNGWLVYT